MEQRMIYCIFRGAPELFESVYIGMTKNLERRMAKHGHPPSWAVLETVEGFEQACIRETFWIDHFKSLGVTVINKYRPRLYPDSAPRPLRKLAWLKAAIIQHGESNECLLWPYSTSGPGYGQVPIGNGRCETSHRLAWKQAHPGEEIPDGIQVMHSDNCVSKRCFNRKHLTLGTQQENTDDAKELGLMRGPGKGTTAGEKNGRAILTPGKVMQIRELFQSGVSYRALGQRFGVGKSTIERAVKGATWAHLPGQMARAQKSITTCPHLDVEIDARVDWIESPGAHMLVVMLRCSECHTPFEFIGVTPGMRFDTPMMSANRVQLRCPIKPVGVESPMVPKSDNQHSEGASKLQ